MMNPYPPPAPPAPAAPRTPGTAVAALVLGICSLVFCWWGLATLAMVVLAVVFGASSARRSGMGVAGLICGCVGFLAYLAFGVATLGTGFLI
jgi:apolipoprotein N-acyltransferase